jgi:excisionase family DNA binding protein
LNQLHKFVEEDKMDRDDHSRRFEGMHREIEQSDGDERVVSITEAARINNVTRQAIYVAIKQKKLRAQKDSTRWTIHLDDLEEYRKQKYSRLKSTFNGELLFDNKRGYFSVNQAAKMLGVPAQKIYYATRIGVLQAHRKGAAWVIHIDDIKGYQEKYLSRRSHSDVAAG